LASRPAGHHAHPHLPLRLRQRHVAAVGRVPPWAGCGPGCCCRGLWGQPLAANSLGGGAERWCGTCPARAQLNCGLEHAQAGCADALRCRSGLLGLLTRSGVSPCSALALTVAAGVQAVCGSAAPRWVTGIDRVDSIAPLLSVLGGLPGVVVVLGRGRRDGGCWCGARAAAVVCLAPECTGTPCFVALIRTHLQLLAYGALKSPARPRDTRALPSFSAATHTPCSEGRFGRKFEVEGG